MLLDEDKDVIYYNYEYNTVDYKHPDKNIVCQYLIDLLVGYPEGRRKIIEIKPEKLTTNPINIAKIEAAKAEAIDKGYDFQVWTEVELWGTEDTEKKMRVFTEWLKEINPKEQEPHI